MNDLYSFPLIDRNDHEILMHKDAHFGGSFTAMISYYEQEGKGAQAEFELKRIRLLHEMEDKSGQSLSEVFLDEEEKKEVALAKQKYLLLRQVYESAKDSLAAHIADLILSEDPDATEEINKIAEHGKSAVPALIELLGQDEFYNPLFPGYAHAPAHAATCLGKIKDSRAITPLFEALGKADFYTEEAILSALTSFGQEAIDFLSKVVAKEPFTKENENASIALLNFPLSEELSKSFLQLLSNPSSHKRPQFLLYLVLGCEGLKDKSLRSKFLGIVDTLPSREAKEEAHLIASKWK